MLHFARDRTALNEIAALAHRRRTSVAQFVIGLCLLLAGGGLCRGLLRRRTRIEIRAARGSRAGFTMIELMVSLGVIALLVALILPAVQSARESARGVTCGNRMRQIGVALENFRSTNGRYPAGSLSGIGTGGIRTDNRSPHVELLPYLDQEALHAKYTRGESNSGVGDDPPTSALNAELLAIEVDVFTCPSDSADSPRCNYRVSSGTSPWIHETIPKSPTAALQGYRGNDGRFDQSFRDGKSHTAAFAEKLAGDRDPERYTPWRDSVYVSVGSPGLRTPDDALNACSRPVDPNPKHYSFGGSTWVLSGYPQTWYNHVLTPNSRIPDCVNGSPMSHGAFAARSLHPGGVNVLFADGAVRFIADGIDLAVWRALGSIDGGETVSLE